MGVKQAHRPAAEWALPSITWTWASLGRAVGIACYHWCFRTDPKMPMRKSGGPGNHSRQQSYFTKTTLTGQMPCPVESEAHIGGLDSLRIGIGSLNPFTDAPPDFLEPGSWISTVNHSPQKAQTLCCVVSVLAHVVFCDPGVKSEEAVHAPGLGKYVRRVAKLRGFDDHGFLNIEDVFIPKQIHAACPAAELAIEEWIIIGAPADLCDIKISGKVQPGTHLCQLCLLHGSMLQQQAHLIQRPRVLTKAMVGRFRRLQLLREVGWHLYIQTAGQRGFPSHQIPLAMPLPVFATTGRMCPQLRSCFPVDASIGSKCGPSEFGERQDRARTQVCDAHRDTAHGLRRSHIYAVGCGIAGDFRSGENARMRRAKNVLPSREGSPPTRRDPKPPYGK